MKLRRVLFVGPMRTGSTSVPRARGLESLGLDVAVLDSVDAYGSSLLAKRIGVRLFVTPSAFQMNTALLAAAAKHRPDVVWMEKADWLHLPTLRRLREQVRYLVHYNTDDFFSRKNHFWLARLGMAYFDAHVTTNRFNVTEIPRRCGRPAFRVGMGFDQDLHVSPKRSGSGEAPGAIVFIGHWERHTEEYVVALQSAGLRVVVWGHNWRHARTPKLRTVQPLAQECYVPTIAGATLALCSLSRMNRNESTGRSFEIPAIGACLLAERTAEHEFLYRDGADAVLFSGTEELVRKARYFLDHNEERQAVARAGHERCLGLELSWGGHVAREWPLLERLLLTGQGPERGVEDTPFWLGFRAGEPFVGASP